MNRPYNDDFLRYFKEAASACLLFFTPLIFFLISTSVFAGNTVSQPHVLLLNSYHKGYLWSDEITRGVEENLDAAGGMLHIEYMDTKRHFDEDYFELLSQMLSLKHSKYHTHLNFDIHLN